MKKVPLVLLLSLLFILSGAFEIAAGTPQFPSLTPAEKLFLSHDYSEFEVEAGDLHVPEREGREERAPRENEEIDEAAASLVIPHPIYTVQFISLDLILPKTSSHKTFPSNKAPPCIYS